MAVHIERCTSDAGPLSLLKAGLRGICAGPIEEQRHNSCSSRTLRVATAHTLPVGVNARLAVWAPCRRRGPTAEVSRVPFPREALREPRMQRGRDLASLSGKHLLSAARLVLCRQSSFGDEG